MNFVLKAVHKGSCVLIVMKRTSPVLAISIVALVGLLIATPIRGEVAECRWTSTPIKIDGKADEPAWEKAPVISEFFIVPFKPDEEAKPTTPTKAKLLWDDEGLYFFAEMVDADLYGDETEEDGELWMNDVFELFFKPATDKPGYYEFEFNVRDAQLHMFLPRRNAGGFKRFIRERDFHIKSKVQLSGTLNKWEDEDQGWSVEGMIPWSDFEKTGGKPAEGDEWTFALCRYDYSVHLADGVELSSNAKITQRNFHYFEDYVPLRFIGEDKIVKVVKELQPVKKGVAFSKVIGSPEPPPMLRAEPAFPDLKLSGLITFRYMPGNEYLFYVDRPDPKLGARIRKMRLKDGTITTVWEPNQLIYSLEFHPEFATNGHLYTGHNGPSTIPLAERISRITRLTLNPETGDLVSDSEFEFLQWPSGGHDGSALAFGNDGMLYITTGDGTNDQDENIVGQGLDHLYSKVLRIDVDNPADGKPYSVPEDNPFVGQPNVRPETWAYGFRNPWRMSYDKRKGHLWVGNNGQDWLEQIYLVEKGANYGWSVYEGSRLFYKDRKLGPTPVSKPTLEHHHYEARSLTGGEVYYGEQFPELFGAYLYGDNSTGKIWAAKHDGKEVTWHAEIADTQAAITAIGPSPEGEILIADYQPNEQGGFWKLVINEAKKSNDFPLKLSETGLFREVKAHDVQPTLLPYHVAVPQWIDGATKERYLALPAEEEKIGFSPRRGWNFSEGTVAMETLSLAMDERKPEEQKRIETRLLTKQNGEWVGYSYLWNEEQTDAELVDKHGRDLKFTIETPGGSKRKQTWRIPARTECGICHTRAANFVLGLQTAQMNSEFNYGEGDGVNQIEVMQELALFSTKKIDVASQDKLVDPYDPNHDLETRVRSLLHANCSHCHVRSGGGNSQIDLRFFVQREEMGLFGVKILCMVHSD